MIFENIFNFLDLYHQKRIINFIKKYNIKYFVDIGAHKGEFLSYILRLKYKKIFCFEPQRNIYRQLFKKFKKNKKIKFYNIGLSKENSKRTIFINKLTSTSTFSKYKVSNFLRIKNFILNSPNTFIDKYNVNIRKLDDVITNKEVKDCFLKIDVEGFELNVLKGAKKFLSNKTKLVLVERHFFHVNGKNSSQKVHIFLKKNNFKLLKKFTNPLFHFQDNLYIKNNN